MRKEERMTNREKVKRERERQNDINTCITNRKKMIGYSAAYVFKLKEH